VKDEFYPIEIKDTKDTYTKNVKREKEWIVLI
jgi:hypothetical protein